MSRLKSEKLASLPLTAQRKLLQTLDWTQTIFANKQLRVFAMVSFAAFSLTGCTMCAPGYLDDYATVGGKWQRHDPANGRVGSIFSDPGSSQSAGESVVMEPGEYYPESQFGEASTMPSGEGEYSSDPYLENEFAPGQTIMGEGW